MLLFVAFVAIMTITFGTVALLTGTPQSQRVIDKRIDGILTTGPHASLESPRCSSCSRWNDEQLRMAERVLRAIRSSQMLESRILQANSKTTSCQAGDQDHFLAIAGFAGVSFFVHVAGASDSGGAASLPTSLLVCSRSNGAAELRHSMRRCPMRST